MGVLQIVAHTGNVELLEYAMVSLGCVFACRDPRGLREGTARTVIEVAMLAGHIGVLDFVLRHEPLAFEVEVRSI
jgi:hypothetical protein